MVVVVSDRWDPDWGGRERYAADFVSYLAAEGQHVTKALVGCVPPAYASRVLALAPTRAATHYQLHGGLLADAFEADRESMRSAIRRGFYRPALFCNRRRMRLLDAEARLLEGAAALMAFSQGVVRTLVRDRGVPPERVALARPGVDLRRFTPSPDEPEDVPRERPLQLLFVGHNFRLKGLRAALGALARVRRAGVAASMRVVGAGVARPFQRIGAQLGILDHVRFLGRLAQDEVAALYRSSDALVHPTFYDPFPRVIIEALACGCPVITTERCGAAECLTAGREAFIVRDPDDVPAIRDAIGALADPRKRRTMRSAAVALGRQFDDQMHFRAASAWLLRPDGRATPTA